MLFSMMALLSALGQLTSDLYLPSFLAIAAGLECDVSLVQWTLATYFVGGTFGQFIYGPLSDGLGRRLPLLCGLAMGLVGGMICWFAPSIEVLLIGRFFQALGISAGSALLWPVLRDLYTGDDLVRYGSYAALISTTFLALGPLIGGYLQVYWGWRSNFLFLVICTSLLAGLSVFLVQETSQHRDRANLQWRVLFSHMRELILSPVFMVYSLSSSLAFGAISAWLTSGAVVLQHVVGYSAIEFGWSYVLTGVGFVSGALLNSRLGPRWGIDIMLLMGLSIISISGLVMLLLFSLGYVSGHVMVGPAILLLFGASWVFPNAFAGSFAHYPHIAGAAGCLFGCMRILGGVITSSILAFAHDDHQGPMAFVILCAGLLGMLIFYMVKEKSK